MMESLPQNLVGRVHETTRTVGERDTAHTFGNEGVYVLGTPALLGWLEDAALAAVAPALRSGTHTVGTAVSMAHLAPAPLGAEVEVWARITAVKGPKVEFEVGARDRLEEICRGSHERFVVESERIDRRLDRKRAELGL